MASTERSDPAVATPQDVPRASHPQPDQPASSTPVEMTYLPSTSNIQEEQPMAAEQQSGNASETAGPPQAEAGPSRIPESATQAPSENHPQPLATTTAPADLTRLQSTVIGPSSDDPIAIPQQAEPTLMITLLLMNGARHLFKLDGKYLRKRNVDVQESDPFNMSVYKLKELIMREWREEWEPKPSSPSLIRLISFGKLLDDKAPLRDSKFNVDTPNVVHMTVKPQDMLDEEEAAGKGGKGRKCSGDPNDRSPGCRCAIL